MNKQQDISKRIEETLNSLDGIQRAEPAPFLFTRVKARLEREEKSIFEKIGFIMTRPSVAIAGLCLILALNAAIFFKKDDSGTTSAIVQGNTLTKPAMPEEDYIIAVAGTYDYENFEP